MVFSGAAAAARPPQYKGLRPSYHSPKSKLPTISALSALACPVCWGEANSPMVDGAKAGVAVLLGIVVCLLIAIALIARSWARRARSLDAQGSLSPTLRSPAALAPSTLAS